MDRDRADINQRESQVIAYTNSHDTLLFLVFSSKENIKGLEIFENSDTRLKKKKTTKHKPNRLMGYLR